MEIEQRAPLISKKLWTIIRTLVYMMKKNISENIPWQLRVTDSPFPVPEQETVDENGVQVDKKADEFIKNFYNELKMQKKRAAIEPPTPSPSRYR
nr:transcription factor like [Tanacetum cinerariifolium]